MADNGTPETGGNVKLTDRFLNFIEKAGNKLSKFMANKKSTQLRL